MNNIKIKFLYTIFKWISYRIEKIYITQFITEQELSLIHNPVISFGGVQHEVINIFTSNFIRKLFKMYSAL